MKISVPSAERDPSSVDVITPSRNKEGCLQFKRALQAFYDTKSYLSLPVLIPF